MFKTNDKKVCSFFASDYHFEMITLPYIEKELESNKKVVVFTENSLNDTMQFLLSKVNLKEDKKNLIREINWNNDDKEKFDELKNMNEDVSIIIKGDEDYISKTRQQLDNLNTNSRASFIDCYDINSIGNNVSEISKKYNTILSTLGEVKNN